MKVGISGHQDLGSVQTTHWVRNEIRERLGSMEFSSGLSSLAAGADQLFAEVVLELGWELEVVIPCHRYEETFDEPKGFELFLSLKQRASKCSLLEFEAPSEQAFYRAGCLIAEMSDLMLAVWNGMPARGLGGTADIVNYALENGKSVIHLNPELQTVRNLIQK